MKSVCQIAGFFVFLFLLASFPVMIDISEGTIDIHGEVALELVKDYATGLFSGQSFIYEEGINRHPNFLQDVPKHWITSFLYLFCTSIIAISISLFIAAWHSKSKREWMKDLLGFTGMVPDFILVLFLQLGTVFFYQTTGFRLARIASRGVDEHAILLPLITLTIIPAIYLIRSLSERTYDVLTEDYILTAKAKGLKKRNIFVQHVIRNVLPYLNADVHKVIAIMMSNLFIVEYLFNISGLTALIFNTGSGYQFNLTVNTLLSLVLLYILLYWSIRLYITLLERFFAYD